MGIGVTELLIILGIVLLIFGTKKLRNLGGDLGGAIKEFKDAVREEKQAPKLESQAGETIENEAANKSKSQ